MKSKSITINEVNITVFEDGSVEKRHYVGLKRQFGCNMRGYRAIRVGGKCFLAHRLVAKAFLDDFSEDLQVDHINGDKSDNRPENLRMVTHQENCRAFARKIKGTSSKFRGVCWHKGAKKWVAFINVEGKQKYLGLFTSEEEAALAWNEASIKYGYAEEALNPI